ncbi:glycoside hydrolase family 16 protein [Kordia sp.]|uniref:glycoside hydrolase family 16 protein n=1 Tax=Kordia sp. TaxID=1965332 RepID=UPI003B5C9877
MKLINKISLRRRDTLLIGLMLLAIAALTISCEADETQEVTTLTNLTFEDNFDTAGAPNSAVWNYDIGNGTADTGPGWGNNELQYYTNRPENIRVEDGVLKIIATQESFEGSGYTSARINTKGLFTQKYGRFEARIQLPWGQGVWPAFWLLGENIDTVSWPFCGEIDVMENRGQEPTVVTGSVHGPGYSGGNAISKEYDLVNDRLDTGFHIFGIEWGPDYINYYIDDVLYNQITPEDVTGDWVFNQPFYIIMNVAVGGSFAGPPSQQTVFPQTMLVDYVRVYQ